MTGEDADMEMEDPVPVITRKHNDFYSCCNKSLDCSKVFTPKSLVDRFMLLGIYLRAVSQNSVNIKDQ